MGTRGRSRVFLAWGILPWLALGWATCETGLCCGKALAGERDAFVTDLEARTLRYFLDHAHPKTGLVRDRARNAGETPEGGAYEVASVAGTGFALAAWASAVERGHLERDRAMALSMRSLAFVEERLFHHHGWLYHFVDWRTGERWRDSEISTIDTALFLAGALYAAHVFRGTPIEAAANRLHERLDFSVMMTNGGRQPEKRTLSHGWTPERGYLASEWDHYSELLVLVLLGLGHPSRPLPVEAWTAWSRAAAPFDGRAVMGLHLPLFVHQYSHLFLDLRLLGEEGKRFFENSVLATRHDRESATRDRTFATYRAGLWGRSASGSPDGYRAFSPLLHDGTVCPGCAGASIPFDPRIVKELEAWAKAAEGRLWGRYGFPDSVNLGRRWFDPDVLAITVGPLYLALGELEPDKGVWRATRELPWVRRAVARLGRLGESVSSRK